MNTIKLQCVTQYDPCFGFKLIRNGEVIYARMNVSQYLIHLEDARGCLLGTIYTSDLYRHFAVAI